MRFARKHDEVELQKLVEWQRSMKSKGANKEKPIRPDVSFWFPPSDVTNAAFIQNAMACEQGNAHTQYFLALLVHDQVNISLTITHIGISQSVELLRQNL